MTAQSFNKDNMSRGEVVTRGAVQVPKAETSFGYAQAMGNKAERLIAEILTEGFRVLVLSIASELEDTERRKATTASILQRVRSRLWQHFGPGVVRVDKCGTDDGPDTGIRISLTGERIPLLRPMTVRIAADLAERGRLSPMVDYVVPA